MEEILCDKNLYCVCVFVSQSDSQTLGPPLEFKNALQKGYDFGLILSQGPSDHSSQIKLAYLRT